MSVKLGVVESATVDRVSVQHAARALRDLALVLEWCVKFDEHRRNANDRPVMTGSVF